MAYAPHLAKIFKEIGYEWTITEDVAFSEIYGFVPSRWIATNYELGVFLRSNLWSKKIAFKEYNSARQFFEDFYISQNSWQPKDSYVILAMDGETFGHHHKGYLSFLSDLFKYITSHPKMVLATLSDIYAAFPKKEHPVPATSWSVVPEDVRNQNPFPLWKDPDNLAHQISWNIVDLALKAVEKHPHLQGQLDKALTSCTFWWMSRWQWDPKCVAPGFKELSEVIIESGEANLIKKLDELVIELRKIYGKNFPYGEKKK